MKKYAVITLLCILSLVGCRQNGSSRMADSQIEKKVAQKLSEMTLDEKLGQMLQINLTVLGQYDANGEFLLNPDILRKVLVDYKVGSILNSPGAAMTPEQWRKTITEIQRLSLEATGIPCLYGLDHIHGCGYIQGATLFPQPINIGASFNPELSRRASEITAYESRACSVPYTFSPAMDLTRQQTWSRVWESYGEDPLVNEKMGEAAVVGFQGEDWNHIDNRHIAVSLKHYMAYGAPSTGKDRTPASVSRHELREKYFPPFEACIKAGALSLMVNSGSNCGMPLHADRELLTGWIKEDLDWDGVIITDWADIDNLYKREKIATDKKDAIRIAINAGIDLAMDPYDVGFCDLLKELVDEGKVKMSRIDDAVSRVLRMKYRLGLFEEPMQNLSDYPLLGTFDKESFDAATESIVLLKNEGILPLMAGQKILVCGPNANSIRALNGGWSYTWQGDADRYAAQYNTVFEALSNKFPGKVSLAEGVKWINGPDWQAETEFNASSIRAAAAASDVIVAVIGENSYCETPGNIDNLAISVNQRKLLEFIESTGKPVVLVLVGGRSRTIHEYVAGASAIVDAFLPGNMGGEAIASLLLGESNFSAKMPYSYPNAANSMVNYDFKPSQQVGTMEGAYNYSADASCEWPFGYGLSYSKFEYSNLSVSKTEFAPSDSILARIDVTNVGQVAGKEAVLLFSSDLVASLIPDVRRLRDFTKIKLAPGETRTVEFTLKASDLAFVNLDGKWQIEEGDFLLQIGNQTATVRCTANETFDKVKRY